MMFETLRGAIRNVNSAESCRDMCATIKANLESGALAMWQAQRLVGMLVRKVGKYGCA